MKSARIFSEVNFERLLVLSIFERVIVLPSAEIFSVSSSRTLPLPRLVVGGELTEPGGRPLGFDIFSAFGFGFGLGPRFFGGLFGSGGRPI
jgi:hypothetical protein